VLRRANMPAAVLLRDNKRAEALRRAPERERIRRANVSAFHLGRKRSAETCAKIGAEIRSRELGKGRGRLPGYKQSAETIAKRVEARKWYRHGPEVRARISAAQTGSKHSAEHKAKIGAAHLGKTRSSEAKKRMSAAQSRPDILAKMSLARAEQSRRKQPTRIELAVRDALTAAGVEFVFQYPIGRYVADFFLPSKNLILECDGDYWHSLPGVKEKDSSRDAYLAARGYRVIRLAEHRIKTGAAALLEEMVS